MKKFLLMAVAVSALFAACDTKKSDEEASKAIQDATKQELEVAVADRDSLLSLVNDIAAGMNQIKDLQNILTVNGVENQDERSRIMADMAAIQQTLEQRKKQLEELEAKLKKSNLTNSQLRQTIETLRGQIESQTAEIASLRNSLDDANAEIGRLNSAVASLNSAVDTAKQERDAAIERGTELANQLNTCYYVAASSKELKEHKILEGGFLRKTKLMEADFDKNFFTKADKRTLRTINLHSKKAKVLSNQPADSYEIVDSNGQKMLRILNPAAFWNLSNYLIVQID